MIEIYFTHIYEPHLYSSKGLGRFKSNYSIKKKVPIGLLARMQEVLAIGYGTYHNILVSFYD